MCVYVIKSVWVYMGVVCCVIGVCMVADYMSGIEIAVCVGLGMRWGCLCNWYIYIWDVVYVRERHIPIAHPIDPCTRQHPKYTQAPPTLHPETHPTPSKHSHTPYIRP